MRSRLGIAAAALLWGLACQGESVGPTTDEYEAQRARMASRKAQPPEQAAAQEVPPEEVAEGVGASDAGFTYDETDKRDPFRSFVLDLEQFRETERGPLEQFELNQLSVVAVVWDARHPRALVQDPSGQGYIVRTGTRIGKNQGRIIDISDASVVVKETYVDYLGDETTKDIEMRISQAQGG